MLSQHDAIPTVAVKNLTTAKKFYEGTLGLEALDGAHRTIGRTAASHQHQRARSARDEPAGHREAETAEPAAHQVRGVASHQRPLAGRLGHHDLPDVPGLRHVAERGRGIREREYGSRKRAEHPHRDIVDQPLEHRSDGGRRFRAHRAEVQPGVPHVLPDLRDLLPAPGSGLADLDEATVGRQRAHARRDEVARERIQHHVRSAAVGSGQHLIAEIERARVHDVRHTQVGEKLALRGTSRGGEDLGADALR